MTMPIIPIPMPIPMPIGKRTFSWKRPLPPAVSALILPKQTTEGAT